MVTTFMAASGWVLWLVIFGICVLDFAILYDDEHYPTNFGVLVTVAALVGAYLFTDLFAGVRWTTVLVGVLAYVAAGVLWSVKKWYTFLVERRAYFADTYQSTTKASDKETLAEYLVRKRPTGKENKSRIVAWMTLWPFSVLWWVLEWPRRLFNWIYNHLRVLYDSMAEKVFRA